MLNVSHCEYFHSKTFSYSTTTVLKMSESFVDRIFAIVYANDTSLHDIKSCIFFAPFCLNLLGCCH